MTAAEIKDIVQQLQALHIRLHNLTPCDIQLNIAHCDKLIRTAALSHESKASIVLSTFHEPTLTAIHEHYRKNGFTVTRTACNGFDVSWI